MKKYTIAIIFLLLINVSFALDDDWFIKATDAKLEFNMNIPYEITKTSNDYSITGFTINVSGLPDNYVAKSNEDIQEQNIIISLDTNNIKTDLKNTNTRQYEYNIKSTITNKIQNNKISQKIDYPYSLHDIQGKEYYLKATEYIDSDNKEIKDFVNSLEFTDDAFTNINILAYWINNNIEYNLNTMTEDAQQKASWTLENKQAACDEITNLFIASLRAMNIPAKAISGIAYTNIHDDFLPHAWSSVYIDNQWIEFDVTYGEYGYIDPGHIKLIEGNKIDKEFINYEWTAKDIDIVPKETNYDINIVESTIPKTTSSYSDRININGVMITKDIKYTELDIGSYNVIELEFENKNNAYTVINMDVITPNETKIVSGKQNLIVLKPNERLERNIIIKYPDDLYSTYLYTFPLDLDFKSNNYNNKFEENISVSANFDKKSLIDIQEYLRDSNGLEIIEGKYIVSSSFIDSEYNIENECELEKQSNKNYKLNCYMLNGIKNTNLDICLDNKCISKYTDKGQLIDYSFDIEYDEDKIYELDIKDNDVNIVCKNYAIRKELTQIKDQENIELKDLNNQAILNIVLQPIEQQDLIANNNCETIDILLETNYSIMIKVNDKGHDEKADIVNTLNLDISSIIDKEENNINILLYDHDELIDEQEITIKYTNLGFFDKIKLFFRRLF